MSSVWRCALLLGDVPVGLALVCACVIGLFGFGFWFGFACLWIPVYFALLWGWYNIAFAKGCGFWWIMLLVVGAGVFGGLGC